jgi:N utilization substance protein B
MQALYYIDLSHRDTEDALALFRRAFTPPKKVEPFFDELVRGVWRDRKAIDRIVERYSDHWRVSRMACVDRNILRIAVYEMLRHRDIPPTVSINEAIEMGKRFGTDASGPFINGILDRVRMAIDNSEIEPLPDLPSPTETHNDERSET